MGQGNPPNAPGATNKCATRRHHHRHHHERSLHRHSVRGTVWIADTRFVHSFARDHKPEEPGTHSPETNKKGYRAQKIKGGKKKGKRGRQVEEVQAVCDTSKA